MARFGILISLLLFSGATRAADYAPLDKELWTTLGSTLADIPMTLSAHQRVQMTLRALEQEAQARAEKAAAEKAASEKPADK